MFIRVVVITTQLMKWILVFAADFVDTTLEPSTR
jgi:hypothetical protein